MLLAPREELQRASLPAEKMWDNGESPGWGVRPWGSRASSAADQLGGLGQFR